MCTPRPRPALIIADPLMPHALHEHLPADVIRCTLDKALAISGQSLGDGRCSTNEEEDA